MLALALPSEGMDPGYVPVAGVLNPGTYLIEIASVRPIEQDELTTQLAAWTFKDVILDQSSHDPTRLRAKAATLGTVLGVKHYRFVAKVETPIAIQDTPFLRWVFVHLSPLDLHAEPQKRIPIKPFRLLSGKVYAMRFLSRMKAQKTREEVSELLAYMGFAPIKVTGLRRNMRVEGRPNISMTRWYALGEWQKADSYVLEEDPFIFEDVVPIEMEIE